MTELEKRLEELSFRREYKYIEKTDIKNVKRIPHKQKRKPLIIEFSGVPKSGKSTCIEAVKKILSVNGFNVKVIEEKAPKCPLNKFNIMFNFWTYTNFLNELNEILQYNERFSNDKKYDVILCDRGGFDALVWFYWQLQKQSISLQEYNKLKELILWDRIWRNVQDVIVFKCKAEDALSREPATSIVPGLNHSIMNRSVLDNLYSYIDIIEKEFEHCNTQIITVESIYGQENKLKKEVLKKVLDCIERHYDEDIAYIERKSLPLQLSTGVLSSTIVDTRSLNQSLTFIQAEQEFSNAGISFGEAQKKSLGIIGRDGCYTNLGLLLSDQCEHKIKFAVYEGTQKQVFKDRHEFSGSLFRQFEDLTRMIDSYNRLSSPKLDGMKRIDQRDYPVQAIREALLNALIHREYGLGGYTLISMFDDRMEIVSLGGLIRGVEMSDIMMGVSYLRNKRLAEIFYRLQLIEAYGTGIDKIKESYKGQAKQPVFESSPNAFKIILPKYGAKAMVKDEREDEIIALIKKKDEIIRSDVEELLNVSPATATRLLTKMVENGQIKRVGSARSIKYKL